MDKNFVESALEDMQLNKDKYVSVHQGQDFEIVMATEQERAMRKVEQSIANAVRQGANSGHVSIEEREENNAVRIKVDSAKFGFIDLLLIANNDRILSDKFTLLVNSKDIQKLGTVMIDSICQNGRVTMIHPVSTAENSASEM